MKRDRVKVTVDSALKTYTVVAFRCMIEFPEGSYLWQDFPVVPRVGETVVVEEGGTEQHWRVIEVQHRPHKDLGDPWQICVRLKPYTPI